MYLLGTADREALPDIKLVGLFLLGISTAQEFSTRLASTHVVRYFYAVSIELEMIETERSVA